MFYSLKGLLITLENNFLVVECNGVGYKCLTSLYTQSQFKDKIGNEITVYTFFITHVNVIWYIYMWIIMLISATLVCRPIIL